MSVNFVPPKVFTENFSGLGVPNTSYYKQWLGFPAQGLIVWNNSPVTYTIKTSPGGATLGIATPNFVTGFVLPSTPSLALVGDGTAVTATNSLMIQVQNAPLGAPFAAQFGEPFNNVFPQAVTFQQNVTIQGLLALNSLVAGLQIFDRDQIGNDTFVIVAQNGQLRISSSTGTIPGSTLLGLDENGQVQLKGTTAGVQLFDIDGVTSDSFKLFEQNSFLVFQSNVNGVLTNSLTFNENGSMTIQGAGAEYRFDDEAGVATHDFSWYANLNVARLFSYGAGQDEITVDTAGNLSAVGHVYPGTPAGAFQSASGLLAGTGVPNNAQGNNGDFYFRSDGGAGSCIYQKRAGSWVATGA